MVNMFVEVLCSCCKLYYLITYSPQSLEKQGEELGMCNTCISNETPAYYDD